MERLRLKQDIISFYVLEIDLNASECVLYTERHVSEVHYIAVTALYGCCNCFTGSIYTLELYTLWTHLIAYKAH